MENVKLKSQKMVKCGHVWVGLFRQAVTTAAKSATIQLEDVSSPSKPSQQLTEAVNLKKRKLEQALLEQESKKSRSATTFVSTDTKQGRDTLQMLMEKKKREMERKAQSTSQHSSKQEPKKKVANKEQEVSQEKPVEKSIVSVKPTTSVEVLLVPKSLHALEELHQQQMEQLKKQRMAPIPLILEQQFSDKLPYVDIPLVVPRA